MPRDIDPDNFNKAAAEKASNTIFMKTMGRIRTPDTEELWELWFDRYEEEGGKVIIVEERGKPPVKMEVICEPKKPIEFPRIPVKPQVKPIAKPIATTKEKPIVKPKVIPPLILKIVELEFLSDHRLLKNNDANWENTGAVFKKPDWTPEKSNPISHSMDKKAKVRVVIEAEGEAPDDGQITAQFQGKEFFLSKQVTFNIGKNELTLTSKEDLSGKIGHKDATFKWSATTTRNPESTSIGNTVNHIYITFSNPVSRPSEPDDGVTVYRMKKSISFILATKTEEPHGIVAKLMGSFPTYTLEKNDAVPVELGHPQYTNPKIGAWALADYSKQTAECQAICRFVRGVLDQVGCPGTVEPVVVWADPVEKKVKEAPYGESKSGLRFVTKTVSENVEEEERVKITEELGGWDKLMGKEPNVRIEIRKKTVTKTVTWNAFLTTDEATVGEDVTDSGLNLYEACLKFTHEGDVKYYGGGAGVFATKTKVVQAFHSLIWVHFEPKDPHDRFSPMIPICKEIVLTF